MPNFKVPQGKLNPNSVYTFIYNMILNQQVTSRNISLEYAKVLNDAKEDTGMYGDQKLYYDTYMPPITDWLGDDESTDLLETKKYRPKSPECQSLVINIYKKVVLVLDKYLTKNAWMNEGAFSDFTSIMMGWIRDVKDVYEMDTYNAFIGSEESSVGKQQVELDLTAVIGAATGEEANRLEAGAIAKSQVDLIGDLMDNTEDYTDYGASGMVRGFSKDDFRILMPLSEANKLTKLGEPTIFHKEGLLEKVEVLPDRFFAKVNTAETAGNGTTVRSRFYQNVPTTATKDKPAKEQVLKAVKAGGLIPTDCTAPANTSVTVDDTILYKVIHKKSVPFISSFEASESFFNAQALNTKYVTVIGHNTLEHLAGKPIVTVRKKA